MFKVGDVVVYSATGVCKISEICEKEFCKTVMKYYVLTPLLQKKSTIFVPIENKKLTGKMHQILSKDEFNKVFNETLKLNTGCLETENERRELFSEILDSGNRSELILMIRNLKKLKREQTENSRRLHIADERLLSNAENLLIEEISYVFEIEKENALDFVMDKFN